VGCFETIDHIEKESNMSNTDGIVTFGLTDQPRALFPTLFTPKKYKKDGKEQGEAKFSSSFLFEADSDELKNLKANAVKIAKAKWGDDIDLKSLKFPFTNGAALKKKADNKGKDGSFYEGQVMMKSSSKFAPTVLDGRQDPPAETIDQKLLYSGCYVAGEVNFVAYNGDDDEDGNEVPGGVTAYLNAIVFVAKGDRIAGKDHAAAFRGITGSASSEDPTGEAELEIGI
jgi:hypothetical protein